MTGAEHYAEAERMITLMDDGAADWEPLAASAQVHATLALAAATALGRAGEGRTMASMDQAAWFDVAAECRKQATA